MKPPKAIPDTLEAKALDYVASILKSSRDDATNIDKLIASAIIIFRAYLNGKS